MSFTVMKWTKKKIEDQGSFISKSYLHFQQDMREDLASQCKKYGIGLRKFNGMHYCFSAILYSPDKDKFVYLSIPDVRFFPFQWRDKVLYRAMKDEKDLTGGTNLYTTWDNIIKDARVLMSR